MMDLWDQGILSETTPCHNSSVVVLSRVLGAHGSRHSVACHVYEFHTVWRAIPCAGAWLKGCDLLLWSCLASCVVGSWTQLAVGLLLLLNLDAALELRGA